MCIYLLLCMCLILEVAAAMMEKPEQTESKIISDIS